MSSPIASVMWSTRASPRAIRGHVPSPISNSTSGRSTSLDLKRKCPARASGLERSAALLDGDEAAEVVPLEEDIDVLETAATEQPDVLLEAIRNEDVLERLALLGDFDLAVTLPLLHCVVVVDEEPV